MLTVLLAVVSGGNSLSEGLDSELFAVSTELRCRVGVKQRPSFHCS